MIFIWSIINFHKYKYLIVLRDVMADAAGRLLTQREGGEPAAWLSLSQKTVKFT